MFLQDQKTIFWVSGTGAGGPGSAGGAGRVGGACGAGVAGPAGGTGGAGAACLSSPREGGRRPPEHPVSLRIL